MIGRALFMQSRARAGFSFSFFLFLIRSYSLMSLKRFMRNPPLREPPLRGGASQDIKSPINPLLRTWADRRSICQILPDFTRFYQIDWHSHELVLHWGVPSLV